MEMKKTKDLCINPLKSHVKCNIFQMDKMKWGPDEDSASDCAWIHIVCVQVTKLHSAMNAYMAFYQIIHIMKCDITCSPYQGAHKKNSKF